MTASGKKAPAEQSSDRHPQLSNAASPNREQHPHSGDQCPLPCLSHRRQILVYARLHNILRRWPSVPVCSRFYCTGTIAYTDLSAFQRTFTTRNVVAIMALLSSPLQTFMNIPPVTKAFTVITVLLSGTYLYLSSQAINHEDPNSLPYLVLVPGTGIWYPWTIITAGFVEIHIIEVRKTAFRHHVSYYAHS